MRFFLILFLITFFNFGCKTIATSKKVQNNREVASNCYPLDQIPEKTILTVSALSEDRYMYNLKLEDKQSDLMLGAVDYRSFLFGSVKHLTHEQLWNTSSGISFIKAHFDRVTGSSVDMSVFDCNENLIGKVARFLTSSNELVLRFHLGNFASPTVAFKGPRSDKRSMTIIADPEYTNINPPQPIFSLKFKEAGQSDSGLKFETWEIRSIPEIQSRYAKQEIPKMYVLVVNQLIWILSQEF